MLYNEDNNLQEIPIFKSFVQLNVETVELVAALGLDLVN